MKYYYIPEMGSWKTDFYMEAKMIGSASLHLDKWAVYAVHLTKKLKCGEKLAQICACHSSSNTSMCTKGLNVVLTNSKSKSLLARTRICSFEREVEQKSVQTRRATSHLTAQRQPSLSLCPHWRLSHSQLALHPPHSSSSMLLASTEH